MPWRRMILQLRQMRFTDASTFMINSLLLDARRSQPFAEVLLLRRDSLLGAEDDARAAQIIRGQLHGYLIAGKDANIVHTHFPGDKTKYYVTIFELYPERCVGEILDNLTLHFNQVFLCHPISPGFRSP